MIETGTRPLYAQVRELLVKRIAEGHWAPGECLPSEHELAEELGVSQGTVRKALDALTAEFLVERRQGRGTFVTEKTPERSLYHYFRLTRENGERVAPDPLQETVMRRKATDEEAARLNLVSGAPIFQIDRIRAIDGRPAILERVVAPADLIADMDAHGTLPNALYSYYQSAHGVNITHANDRLRAVPATAEDAAALGVPAGAPLLSVERVAFDLTDRPVELRVSRFLSDAYGYSVTLR